ncbi:hypothetical protein V8G54_001253 [Vigna mungo]|uniref:Secreted protein n=1 Tax=Vigna mungo TaxID=3915 RepID=A0AAQ3P7I2_VIGMU
MTCGSILGSIDIAVWIACTISPGSGSANTTMSSGKTSGTPPTRVLTVNSPQLAASNMAMQKASVKEQVKKICPDIRTDRTCVCGTAPNKSTLSKRECFSLISSNRTRLGPSPPIMNRTLGCNRHTSGMTSTSKSAPFR